MFPRFKHMAPTRDEPPANHPLKELEDMILIYQILFFHLWGGDVRQPMKQLFLRALQHQREIYDLIPQLITKTSL